MASSKLIVTRLKAKVKVGSLKVDSKLAQLTWTKPEAKDSTVDRQR